MDTQKHCKECWWFYQDYDCGHTNPESETCGDFEDKDDAHTGQEE